MPYHGFNNMDDACYKLPNSLHCYCNDLAVDCDPPPSSDVPGNQLYSLFQPICTQHCLCQVDESAALDHPQRASAFQPFTPDTLSQGGPRHALYLPSSDLPDESVVISATTVDDGSEGPQSDDATSSQAQPPNQLTPSAQPLPGVVVKCPTQSSRYFDFPASQTKMTRSKDLSFFCAPDGFNPWLRCKCDFETLAYSCEIGDAEQQHTPATPRVQRRKVAVALREVCLDNCRCQSSDPSQPHPLAVPLPFFPAPTARIRKVGLVPGAAAAGAVSVPQASSQIPHQCTPYVPIHDFHRLATMKRQRCFGLRTTLDHLEGMREKMAKKEPLTGDDAIMMTGCIGYMRQWLEEESCDLDALGRLDNSPAPSVVPRHT
ncbi:MAG: hypothetical protein M1833_001111 [Piccolia ochrophora]|nr:MAG: hypothetical protein M1833_001111 [Piccolia ochrophora]